MLADAYTTYDHIEMILRYRGPKYFYIYEHRNEDSFTKFEPNSTDDSKFFNFYNIFK